MRPLRWASLSLFVFLVCCGFTDCGQQDLTDTENNALADVSDNADLSDHDAGDLQDDADVTGDNECETLKDLGGQSGCYLTKTTYLIDGCGSPVSALNNNAQFFKIVDAGNQISVVEPGGYQYILPNTATDTFSIDLSTLMGGRFRGTYGIRFVGDNRFEGWLSQLAPCGREVKIYGERKSVSP